MSEPALAVKAFAAIAAVLVLLGARFYFDDKHDEQVGSNRKEESEARCAPAFDEALKEAIEFGKTLASPMEVASMADPQTVERHKSRLHDLNWAKNGLQEPPGSEWHRRVRSSAICSEAAIGRISMLAPVYKSNPATESYEQMVRRTWEEADKANREVDKAQDQMLEDYRRKAKVAKTTSHSGVRIDTFIMPGGEVIVCRTTVRNNARATSC